MTELEYNNIQEMFEFIADYSDKYAVDHRIRKNQKNAIAELVNDTQLVRELGLTNKIKELQECVQTLKISRIKELSKDIAYDYYGYKAEQEARAVWEGRAEKHNDDLVWIFDRG